MKNENTLVEKIKSGNKKAFNLFYKKTKVSIDRFISSRVKNSQDAEEIFQDTYLSFLDSLPLYRGGSSLKTYIFAIARHEIADYWRKKYAKKTILTVPYVDQIYIEKLYSAALLGEEIDRVYKMLTSDHVVILKLKYEQGFSVKEIANILEFGVKATESKLFRARKAFKGAYQYLYEKN